VIRLLIVDDHAIVRAGLERLLSAEPDLDVVAAVGGGGEAVAVVDDTAPDVVLMDLSMPGMDGIAATRAIRDRSPGTEVVVLTSFSDRERILQALDAGAIGYLLKDGEPDELVRGVRAAARGESPLDPKAARQLIASRAAAPPPPDPRAELTEREREVLALLAEGTPNKVIARRLDIAEKTVKNHVSRIFQALGVTDRTQAALWVANHAPHA
jgi:DNA-binding NarL/FixJ family response regulator